MRKINLITNTPPIECPYNLELRCLGLDGRDICPKWRWETRERCANINGFDSVEDCMEHHIRIFEEDTISDRFCALDCKYREGYCS